MALIDVINIINSSSLHRKPQNENSRDDFNKNQDLLRVYL